MGSKVKVNRARTVPKQIEQGQNIVQMCKEVIKTDPAIDALDTANTNLVSKRQAATESERTKDQAFETQRTASTTQGAALTALASRVQDLSGGDPGYILSCGLQVRASAKPRPPVTESPTELSTQVNGKPGRIGMKWKAVPDALNYEAQYTTDLTGATGWISASEMPTATKVAFDGLTSGTKYAFRVRGWGKGGAGPWSSPVQRMAP